MGGLVALSYLTVVGGFLSTDAVANTSAPTHTVITQTNAVFVYLISVVWLEEQVTLAKVFSLLACVGGVFWVSFSPTSNQATQGP